MAENFQDNLGFGQSTLAVSGDAVAIGTQAGAKSVIFSNTAGAGHLAWQPSANHTVTIPDANGVIMMTSQAILSISGGGADITSGRAIFSNSNGVSFGVNGNTMTASVAAQTNQTVGFYAVGNTTQNSSTTLDARTISYDGLGIASVGFSNGSVQISVPSPAAQTNQTVGLYAVGNTTQNSSTTLDARTISFDGLGIASVGFSNGSVQVSVPSPAAQTNQTIGYYAVGNTTQNSSTTLDARTVSFDGLGIVTVGFSNGSIQVSASQSAQTIGYYAVGNTTQNSSTTLDARTVSFDGLGIASVGFSNGSIQISVPSPAAQTNQTIGYYAVGNTTQNSSTTLDARTVSFNGLGIVTVGYSNGSVDISATQSAQSVGLYAVGNTTQNSSTTLDARTLSFDGLGAATVGFSNGSVQISAPVQTNQSVGFYAVGNTTQNSSTTLDARTVSFNGLGIVTVGYSNGSIDVSATQSAQTVGLYAVGNTTQNSSTTLDARTLSFNGLGIASVGYSNGSVQISVPSGGGIITLSEFAVGNTTGASSSSAIDQRSVSYGGLGAVSVGFSNGTLQISSPVQTNQSVGFYAVGNTTQNSSTTLDARTISYDALGAMTMGYSNGSIQVSAPNTSSLSGVGGISISTNGQTISISEVNLTNYEPIPWQTSTTTFAAGAGTWYFEPFYLPAPLSGGRINCISQFSGSANQLIFSTANFSNATSGSVSQSYSYVNSAALYTLGAGTNSTRLESLWSNTFSLGIALSASVSANGASLSASCAVSMSFITSINSAGAYTTTNTSSSFSTSTGAGSSLATSRFSAVTSSLQNMLSSSIIIPVGFNTTVNPGNYWYARCWSSASTTAGTSASVLSPANLVAFTVPAQMTNSVRLWGATASATNSIIYPGNGQYSVASAAPPSTVAFSDIRSIGSHLKQYFNFINSTI